jgi:hypothetical protein
MLTAARLPRFPPAFGFDDGAMQLAGCYDSAIGMELW